LYIRPNKGKNIWVIIIITIASLVTIMMIAFIVYKYKIAKD